MIYLYILFLLCSCYLFYIIRNKPEPVIIDYDQPVNIVEIAYRAVDYQTSVTYVDRDHLMNSNYRFDPISLNVINDERHKQRIIEKSVIDLTKKMLSDKVVEIKEVGYMEDYNLAPYEKKINMRLKVYVPE